VHCCDPDESCLEVDDYGVDSIQAGELFDDRGLAMAGADAGVK
jgi:hypothetical protein